jgi:hypothetical protein
MATIRLRENGHTVYPIGLTEGLIGSTAIITGEPDLPAIDTVTLYINPTHQLNWLPYIVKLQPKRVIFNPGTENPGIYPILQKKGIECLEACTLVLLSLNNY